MGRRYPDVEPGEWIRPRRNGYRMLCCDCGLAHALDFRIVKDSAGRSIILLRAYRDNRATAASRKGKRYRKVRRCLT